MNDFQKSFLSRGTGSTLYTQKEFDDQLAIAKAQIMQVAISTTKTAIAIERDECAKIVEKWNETTNEPITPDWLLVLAEQIRNRLLKNEVSE